MKKSKLMVYLLSSMILTSTLFSGCGSKTKDAGTTEEKKVSTEEEKEDVSKEPITFNIKSVMPGKDWDLQETPVGKKFVEKTGVNFKLEGSVGDEQQTIALLIASDNLPDIVLPHYNVGPFIDAGKAMEVSDLIEKYAPNYKKALGSYWDRMKWSKEDQGRYYLCHPEQTPEPLDYRNWFFLQHDVVMKQGYPEIKTLEQYENAIKTYIQKNPTIDGKPTIGMTLLCDQWRWILSLTNPAMMAAGVQSSGEIYVDPQTRKVTYRVTRPEEKEYFRWLNHMYNEGLLDKEAFTQTYDQYKAKIATGRVLALADMGWEFSESEKALLQQGKPERTYGTYPVVLKEGIKNSSFSGERQLITPAAEVVVTENCKSPERFFEALNYMMSEEGQILNNWGIEGQHYDIVDDKRVFKEEELNNRKSDPDYGIKTGIGLLSVFPSYYDGVKDSTGQYYTLSSKEDIIKQYSEIDKKVLDAYGKKTWAEFFPQPEEFPIRQWPSEGMIVNKLPADSEAKVIFSKLQDTIKKDVVKAIVSKPEQFDTAWDQFLADMDKAGVKKFEQACENLMKEQLDIWGIK
jgi:putative aldouronate transport system substrate-binding protein